MNNFFQFQCCQHNVIVSQVLKNMNNFSCINVFPFSLPFTSQTKTKIDKTEKQNCLLFLSSLETVAALYCRILSGFLFSFFSVVRIFFFDCNCLKIYGINFLKVWMSLYGRHVEWKVSLCQLDFNWLCSFIFPHFPSA